MQHFKAICIFKLDLQSGKARFGPKLTIFFAPHDLENWRITLKNNKAPFLCYFKLCASFHSHWCIPIGVAVRKRPTWVKISDFLAVWPWNLTDDLEKQQGSSFKLHQALCMISSPYVNSNGLKTAKWGHDLCDLNLWSLTLTFCMDITSVNGNNSWKFQDDTTTGTLSKRCHRRTDERTDRQTDGNKCS